MIGHNLIFSKQTIELQTTLFLSYAMDSVWIYEMMESCDCANVGVEQAKLEIIRTYKHILI